jgi:hypothetical protein
MPEASIMERLWEIAGVCFDTDDGSLPGIEIANLSPAGVSSIYALLRQRSRLSGNPPQFWSRTHNESVHVDSVPDAARLVVSGDAEAFSHCVEGVIAAGVKLPVLGVFVLPTIVELDYRMGQEWGPAQVAGFFELLKDLCNLDSSAVIVPAKFEGPPYPERFLQAWSMYNKRDDLLEGINS